MTPERWRRVQQVLGYFDGKQARGRHGLLRYDPRFWLFEDWSTLAKCEIPTFLNLWYLHALQLLERLLEAAGMDGEAAEIGVRVAEHEQLACAHLHDADSGLFVNGLDEHGERVAGASVHDQTLALLTGLRSEDHERMITARLLPYLRGEDLGDAAKPSPMAAPSATPGPRIPATTWCASSPACTRRLPSGDASACARRSPPTWTKPAAWSPRRSATSSAPGAAAATRSPWSCSCQRA